MRIRAKERLMLKIKMRMKKRIGVRTWFRIKVRPE